MNCYRHPDKAAVGLCKTCFKGLCPDCATDVGNGLACTETCKVAVGELNEVWERNMRLCGIGRYKTRVPSTNVLFFGVLAAVFWTMAIVVYLADQEATGVFLMAVIFTLLLGAIYWRSRRLGLNM